MAASRRGWDSGARRILAPARTARWVAISAPPTDRGLLSILPLESRLLVRGLPIHQMTLQTTEMRSRRLRDGEHSFRFIESDTLQRRASHEKPCDPSAGP